MNLRNVLKVYGLQRQFNDDESALLKTLQSLNDTERDLLVESLSPAQKKSGKKSVGKLAMKSARGSSIAQQLGSNLTSARMRKTETDDSEDDNRFDGAGAQAAREDLISSGTRCQFIRSDDKPCHLLPDHNIHHMTTANEFHPFVLPAQPAEEQSTTDSSETGKAAASNVHHAGD